MDPYLYVTNSFQVKPGARINDNLFVGHGLGVGLQVRLSGLGSIFRHNSCCRNLHMTSHMGAMFCTPLHMAIDCRVVSSCWKMVKVAQILTESLKPPSSGALVA